MSVRNPLTIIKNQIRTASNRAYHVKGMRDTDEIVAYVDEDVQKAIDPKLFKAMRLAWIRDLIISRAEQTEFFTERLDLFRDLDFQFAFRKKAGWYQCALGDVGLEQIEILQKRKTSNIAAAVSGKKDFRGQSN
jgi:hypothetical protein